MSGESSLLMSELDILLKQRWCHTLSTPFSLWAEVRGWPVEMQWRTRQKIEEKVMLGPMSKSPADFCNNKEQGETVRRSVASTQRKGMGDGTFMKSLEVPVPCGWISGGRADGDGSWCGWQGLSWSFSGSKKELGLKDFRHSQTYIKMNYISFYFLSFSNKKASKGI